MEVIQCCIISPINIQLKDAHQLEVPTRDKSSLKAYRKKLLCSYIAPSEHTLYLVVEADDLSKIEEFTFKRLALVGPTEITPVMAVKEAAERIQKFLKK